MPQPLRIALVGDYDPAVLAHQAIPMALARAGHDLGVDVQPTWLATDSIRETADVDGYHGIWCVPASPYRSADGALLAIRTARESGRPFLGTCGGFQHAVLEYARAVLGWHGAEHGETAPNATRRVIAPLICSLVEVTNRVRFAPDSHLAQAYGQLESHEGYHCRYGVNPEFAEALTAGPLRSVAWDDAGDVRAVEMDEHPFFVATLFQPERAALASITPPVVRAFLEATRQ
jgi:CTP synthase (UTP-ammonia lyase)